MLPTRFLANERRRFQKRLVEHQSHGWRQGDAVALLGLVALCSLCILSLLSLLSEAIMNSTGGGRVMMLRLVEAGRWTGGGRATGWWGQGVGLVEAGR